MDIIEKIFKHSYVLASKSPRRKKLLRQIGLKFISIDSKVSEAVSEDYNPVQLVRHNSTIKSRKVAQQYNKNIIIAADTVVVLDKKIINKPKNTEEAEIFLKNLSGKKHYVYTGINLINTANGKEINDYEKTSVFFRNLTDEEIKYYVKNYQPLDKAGAYGIQDDFGCLFIERIEGDYYNIVGLPLVKLYSSLLKVI